MTSVAIIGAGPYGLSVAAYLRNAGVETLVFGEPLESWYRHMPQGMMLRSRIRSSHIADPRNELGIDAWEADTGARRSEPMPVEQFVSYGRWYQQRAVPDVDRRRVRNLSLAAGGFSLALDDGDEILAERVVVAAGITPFAFYPELFQGLPDNLVSHSSKHTDLGQFAGQDVLVVGGGQSALETAALLHEAGATPRLVARADRLVFFTDEDGFRARAIDMMLPPTDVGGRVSGWLAAAPGALRRLPDPTKTWVTARCTVPAGGHWLRPRMENLSLNVGRTVVDAQQHGDSLQVTYDDGSADTVDHAILCTGYHIDLGRYDFLDPELLCQLELSEGSGVTRLDAPNGAPRLTRGLESSVPGLHITGATAAGSFGPIMRFVVGTWYAAPAIARAITGTRHRPAHLSYRPRLMRNRA
jgi:FAD-dependent urate hydroxylase